MLWQVLLLPLCLKARLYNAHAQEKNKLPLAGSAEEEELVFSD
jgi:hypothetical protein